MRPSPVKLLKLTLATVFVFLTAEAAHAQIGVYAGFTGAHLDSPAGTSTTVYGPLVGVYFQTGRFIAIGADARGSFLNGNNNQFYTGAIGPRVAIKPPVLPIKSYAEALFGIASYNNGISSSNATYANYQILGGVEATILPRIDWRVIEFDYSAVFNNPVNARSLTTGLVIRLPTF
jgi:hypothetical protein